MPVETFNRGTDLPTFWALEIPVFSSVQIQIWVIRTGVFPMRI